MSKNKENEDIYGDVPKPSRHKDGTLKKNDTMIASKKENKKSDCYNSLRNETMRRMQKRNHKYTTISS